jgi:predicted DNA-binding transcriptional regulator AlpA
MTDNITWLDAASVGRLLCLSTRVVRERLALRADWPKPLRIGGVGHPRWRKDEVLEWAEKERQRNEGRARAA